MDVLEALSEQTAVRHVTTRHEQGAAFMADVYGRLTGRAAVAMATLGPGATNLVTGIADAYLDHAPMVAHHRPDRARQAPQGGAPVRRHRPHVRAGDEVEPAGRAAGGGPRDRPQGVPRRPAREAGPDPHRAPGEPRGGAPSPTTCARSSRPRPTSRSRPTRRSPTPPACWPARPGRSSWPATASSARTPRHALRDLANGLHLPVADTFMGKGAIDDRSHLSLMAVGLQARDHVLSGFDRADLVVSVGYDLVEYAPSRWNPDGRKRIIHIDTQPAEVDANYQPEVELVGDIDGTLRRLLPAHAAARASAAATRASGTRPARRSSTRTCGRRCSPSSARSSRTTAGRSSRRRRSSTCAGRSDRRTSWSATSAHTRSGSSRLYQAYEPNTVIISNGFAAMGISLPGAIAAKLVHPDRRVVALCGDGGFLMNSQELETARRIGANITVVVWRDDGYGLIDWKQRTEFGHPFGVEFGNPDFVAYAQSFGLAAFRPDVGRRPLPDPDARAGARRTVARRGPDRLPRERPPDRTPRGARTGLVGRSDQALAGFFGFFGFGGRFGSLVAHDSPRAAGWGLSAVSNDSGHRSRERCHLAHEPLRPQGQLGRVGGARSRVRGG